MDIADPLLNTVGTCLVEGTVVVHVIMNLLVRECLEGDIGCHVETTFFLCSQ